MNGCDNSPVFEFQSRYIEHHFEARATLPPILDVCVAAFLFCLFQNIEEIFKIVCIFALITAYSLRGKNFLRIFCKMVIFLAFSLPTYWGILIFCEFFAKTEYFTPFRWLLLEGLIFSRLYLKTEWPSEWDTSPRLPLWERARKRRWKSRGRNDVRVERQTGSWTVKVGIFSNRIGFNDVHIVWGVPIAKSVFFTSLELWKIGQKCPAYKTKEKTS